ncbi:hypothetical protein RhiirA1_447915, partial [Rhizophagus irregularis]
MFDQTEETLLIIKFECTLQSQEQYIKYLYGVVSGYESEIEELRQKNAELRIKLKNALEAVSLKEEGLQALERQLIEVDTLNIQLKARIKELARRQQKNMPQSPQSHNSIREILNHRDLDAIIRYADELRNIIEDKNNNEVRLEDLLDDAFNREEYLRQELNNTRASVLNTRCTFKDAYIQELHHRQHWKGLAQNTQTQLANSQIQLANTQTQFESRRNAHRLLQRYNRETEWNRRICFQNLNQQFLIIQSAMAGYAPKKFRGVSGEDPELWLQEFRQWCESAGLDPAANARTCVRIHGIFESLLEDDARDWFETHIKGKNWKCANIRNNLAVANLAAANALAQHGQAAVVNTITGADFIPDHTVWDEDWSIVEGRPTDIAVNNPNANNGGTIVAPGIRIGQLIYHFKHYFPTITSEKSKLAFNAIVQGSDTVSRFYSKLRRMVRLAYPTLPEVNQNELVRQQFLNGLSSENKLDARRIGLENSVASILNKLEE